MNRTNKIQAVEDAVGLLNETAHIGNATAQELQRVTGFTRDKTYRLIATLIATGMLTDQGSGRYGLGETAARLWAAYRDRLAREIDHNQKILVETEV